MAPLWLSVVGIFWAIIRITLWRIHLHVSSLMTETIHYEFSVSWQLVSISGDGRILTWKVNASKQRLKLIDGWVNRIIQCLTLEISPYSLTAFFSFVLLTENLPRHLRVRSRGNQEMGVTCLSFSQEDETMFLVGSDCGGVFKCSTNARGNAPSSKLAELKIF